MTPEKILEIARRYTSPEAESRILFGGTVTMTYWNFCEEELIAFAKSVIEADRESNDEPMAWGVLNSGGELCFVTLYPKEYPHDKFIPLYTRPAPARKPLSDEEVEKEFNRRCELDCCPDFSEAVRWAEKMHGIGETE